MAKKGLGTKNPGSPPNAGSPREAAAESPEKKPRREADPDPEAGAARVSSASSFDLRCLQGMFEKFALEVTGKLNSQLQEGFDKQNDRIDSIARKANDTDQKLIELTAAVTSSNTTAQQALQTVADMRKDNNRSYAPSEASTEVPLSERLRGFRPQQPPAPTANPSSTESSPDNDGQTILIGGFPRDTEKQNMQAFITEKLGNTSGIIDLEAKYKLGSTALMRFRTPTLMWSFMRARPSLTYEGKTLFFTIPKSPFERQRDKKISVMRSSIETLAPDTMKVTVLWSEKLVQINGIPVARYCAISSTMQLSVAQLQNAGFASSKAMIMEKYNKALETNEVNASDVKDWS
eukprot:3861806-Heterocapsa_arctica.AAC.1